MNKLLAILILALSAASTGCANMQVVPSKHIANGEHEKTTKVAVGTWR